MATVVDTPVAGSAAGSVASAPAKGNVQQIRARQEPVLVRQGRMQVPDRPGLGVELDEAVLARLRA